MHRPDAVPLGTLEKMGGGESRWLEETEYVVEMNSTHLYYIESPWGHWDWPRWHQYDSYHSCSRPLVHN